MHNKIFKIFMVGYSPNYANWFPFDYEITKDASIANVAWWIGGSDVATWLYGEKEGKFTGVSQESSKYELKCWEYFKDKPTFKIGSCKGLQNLSVYSGCKLVQHSKHPYYHNVKTKDGLKLNAISLHHQQVILDEKITGLKEGKDYSLVAWAEKLSPFHLNGENKDYKFPENYKEPEIVTFKNIWATQSHPEAMDINSPFVKYCQKTLIEKMKEDGFID